MILLEVTDLHDVPTVLMKLSLPNLELPKHKYPELEHLPCVVRRRELAQRLRNILERNPDRYGYHDLVLDKGVKKKMCAGRWVSENKSMHTPCRPKSSFRPDRHTSYIESTTTTTASSRPCLPTANKTATPVPQVPTVQ